MGGGSAREAQPREREDCPRNYPIIQIERTGGNGRGVGSREGEEEGNGCSVLRPMDRPPPSLSSSLLRPLYTSDLPYIFLPFRPIWCPLSHPSYVLPFPVRCAKNGIFLVAVVQRGGKY